MSRIHYLGFCVTIGLSLVLWGCGNSSPRGADGGAPGASGGTPGTGGAPGTGGITGSGGATGMGGATGGSPGSGTGGAGGAVSGAGGAGAASAGHPGSTGGAGAGAGGAISAPPQAPLMCGGGVCTDESGLQWEEPTSGGNVIWDVASNYCQTLGLGGHDDWRLPTLDELRTLVRGCNPTASGGTCRLGTSCATWSCYSDDCLGCSYGLGPATGGCYWDAGLAGTCKEYWSSTTLPDQASEVWLQNYLAGGGMAHIFESSFAPSLRCVRGGGR